MSVIVSSVYKTKMVYRRRSVRKAPRRGVGVRRRGYMARPSRPPMTRQLAINRAGVRTFTECFQAAPLVINTGGVLKCRMNDIPQVARYSALYSQFAIRKMKVVLLPKYGQAEPNAALVGLTAIDYQTGRFAFAINDTPGRRPPASELDVLTDNGARVVMGSKKIVITCYPKPDVGETELATGAAVASRSRALKWFNFFTPELDATGQQVEHGAISWWLSNNPALGALDAFDVYIYVTFSVRDPL